MTKFRKLAISFSVLAVAGAILTLLCERMRQRGAPADHVARAKRTVTFNRDIAPIIFDHCAGCHRPGQAAPFNLLGYEDVRRRAREIAKVTQSRFMPPWLPEPGAVEFADQRGLNADQVGLIKQWAAEGAVEGDSAELPALPKWVEGWQLGEPDLVVRMTEPYTLPADGKDVYRNFVIPIPGSATRYVRAVEFRPENPKIVHHAVMMIDRTPSSRMLDEQDPGPGFGGGMSMGKAQLPDGHFLGWTPGKMPFKGIEEMAWRLEKDTDLVIQLHMRPSGKPEAIQAAVGFFFSSQVPTLHPYAFVLRHKSIDIPPGTKDYTVNETIVLPVDVEALRVYPHAHYLAREMRASAALPDGTQRLLLLIKNWDFNWQDEYRYARPIFLPKGTAISMRYTYDNSSNNIRNPNHPPRRVVYGQSSSDEMAELMLQVLPRTDEDLITLKQSAARQELLKDISVREQRLKAEPNDAKQHVNLGLRYQQVGKNQQAITHFRRAVEIEPDSPRTLYLLGDALAKEGRFDEALGHLKQSVDLKPDQPEPLNAAARILATHFDASARNPTLAISLATRAAELTGDQDPGILDTLAVAYAAAGQLESAVRTAERAIQIAKAAQADEIASGIQKRLDSYKQSQR